jgi:hypothetical protein
MFEAPYIYYLLCLEQENISSGVEEPTAVPIYKKRIKLLIVIL